MANFCCFIQVPIMAILASALLASSSNELKLVVGSSGISAAPASSAPGNEFQVPSPTFSSPDAALPPDVAPLFPTPSGSSMPTIPSNPSPPNPDGSDNVGPDSALAPFGSLPAISSAAASPSSLMMATNLGRAQNLLLLIVVFLAHLSAMAV